MALPATSISSAAPRPSEDVDVDMTSDDSENEEIDQLDSDTTEEEEIPIGDTLSPTSKARLKRAGERVPGQSIIPAARIEHILGAEGVGGHMSKEAIYMLSIATEEFVKRLTHAGQRQASVQKRSMIQYLDLAAATKHRPEFQFLEETIPMPLTLAEALERRAAKARELLEPETAAPTPSIHSPMPMPMPTSISTPTPSVIPSASQSTKPKGKARQSDAKTNGHTKNSPDHVNASSAVAEASASSAVAEASASSAGASASASTAPVVARRQSLREPKPRRRPDEQDDKAFPNTSGTRTRSTKATRAKADTPSHSRRSSAARNGQSASISVSATGGYEDMDGSRSASQTPSAPAPHLPPEYVEANAAVSANREQAWTSIRGSGNGLLGSRPLMFNGRNDITDNPGRTIYSQQRQPNR